MDHFPKYMDEIKKNETTIYSSEWPKLGSFMTVTFEKGVISGDLHVGDQSGSRMEGSLEVPFWDTCH